MSRSPDKSSATADVLAYDKGWAAVNRLIRAGRSFSGRERKCCFLNTGSTRFANVAGAIGVNLSDDGRGLALSDWDQDGRLDFWLTNRTGPRVRFLRNEYVSSSDYVALQLVGTRANRDALGARAEVYLRGQTVPLLRTVYGGSGYISQSSKWLHFGLGKAAEIDRIVVRWPGGATEGFTVGAVNHRYRLQEGTGVATEVPINRTGPWAAHAAEEPAVPVTDRVVLLEPAPVPRQLRVRDLAGQDQPLVPPRSDSHRDSRGVVVNLWATWCSNCLKELSEWTRDRDALAAAGLDVVNVCVDQPSDDPADDRQRVAQTVQQLGLPFHVVLGDAQLVEVLYVFQRAFIGRQTDLPLPSSFLIDRDGRLAVIYKGPVSVAELVRDSRLLNQTRDSIFTLSVPFAGQWLERPPVTVPRMAAVAFVENGYLPSAEDYAQQLLPRYAPATNVAIQDADEREHRNQEFASLHHLLGAMDFDQQRYEDARDHYAAALIATPHNRSLRRELARALSRNNELAAAAEQVERILQDPPADAELMTELARLKVRLGDLVAAEQWFRKSLLVQEQADVRFELANVLRDLKQYSAAIVEYQDVLTKVPSPVVLNNLAWLLATANDPQARDGQQAVTLATRACDMTSRQVPRMLGTLAAAYAETGDFASARESIQQAIQLSTTQDPERVPELRARLSDYERQVPTRDVAP